MKQYLAVVFLLSRWVLIQLSTLIQTRSLKLQAEREKASKLLPAPSETFSGDKKQFLEDLRQALYASKIVSYAQGNQSPYSNKNTNIFFRFHVT